MQQNNRRTISLGRPGRYEPSGKPDAVQSRKVDVFKFQPHFGRCRPQWLQLGGNQAAGWVAVQGDRVGLDLALDHARILADAVERLRSKLEYSHIAVHLLPEEFTLPELQRTYETILQQPLDKSSFRRRVAQADMLEEIPGKLRDGSGRPAQLHRFRDYDRRTFFPRSISRHAR